MSAPMCPRCGHFIPNDEQPGAYPGAMSRLDNRTEICSPCGTAEAMEEFINGKPMPMSEWIVTFRDFGNDLTQMRRVEML